ncbi:hypothetical protein JB92DRAFT_2793251 [Gautieria morchelliformis]|nr:hypothetical protein JB92DRAFT_2793251 [Gautieria morchelliformis]
MDSETVPLREYGSSFNEAPYHFPRTVGSEEYVPTPYLSDESSDQRGFEELPTLTTELKANSPFSFPKRKTITASVVLLASCSLLPAVMGALFYISIGFGAPDGIFRPDGTYVRPIDEGASIGGKRSVITTHFTPLLVSTIASSLIGVISPLVMCLFAYQLGHLWLKASHSRPANLPTPFQYHLTLELVSLVSPISIVRFLSYCLWRSVQDPQVPFQPRTSLRTRTRITPLLMVAVLGATIILTFSWAIKIVDVALHDQIVSTILFVNGSTTTFAANASIRADCLDAVINRCDVINRTQEASLGGLNQSSSFRVYEHGTDDPARSQSIAYIGPASMESSTGVKLSAHTYVAATECQVYHPECFVDSSETIRVCGPASTTVVDVGGWNQFVFNVGFNVTTWQMRLQSFLTGKGNLTVPGAKPPYSLSNAANANPFTTAQWGCFNDYNNIQYSDANSSFSTPFINWWTYGAGIGNQPFILCSISVCNTTVYDAQYNLSNGSIALDNSSFTLANASAAVAVSGSGMFLGTPDTLDYQYGSRFIDDQIQLDLSTAGNTYGNSTQRFGTAWAQALSNRYLGWTAGVIQLDDAPATITRSQLALSIPLATAYLFSILHFVYAFMIVLLGISCLFLPKEGGPSGADVVEAVKGNSRFDPTTELAPVLVPDVSLAHIRLSDTSTLVHELVVRNAFGPYSALGRAAGDTDRLERRRIPSIVGSQRLVDGEGREEDGDLRVALEKQRDGGVLGMTFRTA